MSIQSRKPGVAVLQMVAIVLVSLALTVSLGPAPLQAAEGPDVLDLPLERLLDVPVVSASRKTQALSEVASAVFVITQEDIRHSGATTIPDLLRMVPGVQVASMDGNDWAVSVRGFNGIFANKLLVMIDGRTVYTPLYGGVFWDVQDTLLENIERIEVIRGPGSTMWGANAVNGVINIITKSARDTQGGLVLGLVGSRERGTLGVRYGAELGEQSSYRLYLKHVDRGSTDAINLPSPDTLEITRGGFRVDSALRDGLDFTFQGDVYGGNSDHSYVIPAYASPYFSNPTYAASVFGANLIGRLDWLQAPTSKWSLQLYYDRTQRDIPLVQETRNTVDLDLQHNVNLGGRHELTWGVGYRYLQDSSPGSPFFYLVPDSRGLSHVNLFVQDEISLLPETLRLMLGSKVEHNEFTGWEFAPSAKLSWTPRKGMSLWASVTRSVRTPTRGENDIRIGVGLIPPTPPAGVPTLLVLTGNRGLVSETVISYEAGFRSDLNHAVSLDLSTFFNRYHNIVGNRFGAVVTSGNQQLLPDNFVNLGSIDSTGGEVSLQWQPQDWWKLKGGYALLRVFGEAPQGNPGSKASPEHQATLRSLMSLGKWVDLDLWGRYVGGNYYQLQQENVRIPAYLTLDARLAWRPAPGWELALVGQNLLERRHLETVTDQTLARHEMARSLYGKVTWDF
ncbi:TonB-dependent receptor plug domain-containing protein [Geomonas limicola]|nr:TonB-dependent receptor [Geomonas limicola]